MSARRRRHFVPVAVPFYRAFRALTFLCCVLPTACGGFSRPAPERTDYLIPLSFAPDAAKRGVNAEETEKMEAETAAARVRLGVCSVAAPFAGRAFIYRIDEARYETDYYHGFAVPPQEMLRQATVEYLRGANGLNGLKGLYDAGATDSGAVSYRLDVDVVELYGDFRNKQAPEAVLSIDYGLIRQEEKGHNVVFARRFTERRPLPRTNASDAAEELPEALARAYGEALGTILDQLTREIRPYLAAQKQ